MPELIYIKQSTV